MTKKKLIGLIFLISLFITASAYYGLPLLVDAYENNKPDQFYIVTSTEYSFEDAGQAVARLADFQGNPIIVDNCTVNIAFPNQTYFIQDALMSDSLFPGDHYYDFTVPSTEGIYDYSVTCYWNGINRTGSKAFHVNTPINFSQIQIEFNDTEMIQEIEAVQDLLEGQFHLEVKGTDYYPGDNGRIFLQLTQDSQGFNDAFCQLNIHYPDSIDTNKHYLVKDNFMQNMDVEGNYYYDFTVPDEIGIYMSNAVCYVGINTTTLPPIQENLIQGVSQSGTLSDTTDDDGTYYYIKEQINTGSNRSYVHDFFFDVTTFPNVTNYTLIESAFGIIGRLNPGDTESINISIRNFTGGYFVPMNNIWFSQDSLVDTGITNVPGGIGEGHFKNASDIVWVRLQDNLQTGDTTTQDIRIDRLFVGSTTQVPETVTIQGGVELNVRDRASQINETLDDLRQPMLILP